MVFVTPDHITISMGAALRFLRGEEDQETSSDEDGTTAFAKAPTVQSRSVDYINWWIRTDGTECIPLSDWECRILAEWGGYRNTVSSTPQQGTYMLSGPYDSREKMLEDQKDLAARMNRHLTVVMTMEV